MLPCEIRSKRRVRRREGGRGRGRERRGGKREEGEGRRERGESRQEIRV